MGRQGYSAEFRRRVLDRLAEGHSVASVAHDLDLSDQTIYNWRRQDRIDRGLLPGLNSGLPMAPDGCTPNCGWAAASWSVTARWNC